jgi:hypothetical protein
MRVSLVWIAAGTPNTEITQMELESIGLPTTNSSPMVIRWPYSSVNFRSSTGLHGTNLQTTRSIVYIIDATERTRYLVRATFLPLKQTKMQIIKGELGQELTHPHTRRARLGVHASTINVLLDKFMANVFHITSLGERGAIAPSSSPY